VTSAANSTVQESLDPAALYEVQGNIAVITLNRPDALNAVNSALCTAVGYALEQANNDPTVRVIVLTGAGRAFCAGADLKEIAAGRNIEAEGHPEWGFAGVVRHYVDKPTIAAVNGFALGGGTEIVLACDLAVIDENAKLGLPEVARGLLAGAGGVIRLQRQIPLKVALAAVLTGRPLDAATAAQWGLVNEVAPAGNVLDHALALARVVADNAPIAVQQSKAVVHRSAASGSDWDDDVWALNQRAIDIVFGSEDAREGATAFAEKRKPEWTGR
jgi:enoyl-CoA hydratase/carnithine racemase